VDILSELLSEDKIYYTITEVAALTGLKPHILRYWETEFPMLRPRKNRAGNRVYRKKDIELVLTIKKLLYEDGFTIEGAKRKLREEKKAQHEITPAMYKKVIQEIKKDLLEMALILRMKIR
jgi:DNA-binding transcriptional MerR regulator